MEAKCFKGVVSQYQIRQDEDTKDLHATLNFDQLGDDQESNDDFASIIDAAGDLVGSYMRFDLSTLKEEPVITLTGTHLVTDVFASLSKRQIVFVLDSDHCLHWNNFDFTYLLAALKVIQKGALLENRTDTRAIKLFGPQMEFNLRKGMPVLTTKKVFTKSIFKEIGWFARGETNIKTLGCKIWDDWANELGDCGPIYGMMMTNVQDIRMLDVDRPDCEEVLKLKERGFDIKVIKHDRSVALDNLLNDSDFNLSSFANGVETILAINALNKAGVPFIKAEGGIQVDASYDTPIGTAQETLIVRARDTYRTIQALLSVESKSKNKPYLVIATRTINQLQNVIETLTLDPMSRRNIVCSWNPSLLPMSSRPLTVAERQQMLVDKYVVDGHKMYPEMPATEVYERAIDEVYKIEKDYGEQPDREFDHDLLDELDIPRSVSLKPKDNPAEGQQCLAPCHVLVQYDAVPITTQDRFMNYVERKVREAMTSDPMFILDADSMKPILGELINHIDYSFDLNAGIQFNSISDSGEETDKTVNAILDGFDEPKLWLNSKMYQRSGDTFLGVPFNIASYSTIQMIIAEITNMRADRYIHTFGDMHVYENHIEQLMVQVRQPMKSYPQLKLAKIGATSVADYDLEDMNLTYEPGILLEGEVAE